MKFITGFLFFIVSFQIMAGTSVGPTNIQYVYQLDSDPTVFEFSVNSRNTCGHAGGSYHYRVKSPNEAVADRKFSMVLAAFSSNKRIMFALEGCEGDRGVVSWVRLVH